VRNPLVAKYRLVRVSGAIFSFKKTFPSSELQFFFALVTSWLLLDTSPPRFSIPLSFWALSGSRNNDFPSDRFPLPRDRSTRPRSFNKRFSQRELTVSFSPFPPLYFFSAVETKTRFCANFCIFARRLYKCLKVTSFKNELVRNFHGNVRVF
jgi:hypothetical protein